MNLKNYLVFIGDVYYPQEGWKDFSASFDTREEAKEYVEKQINLEEYKWGQVTFIGEESNREIPIEDYHVYWKADNIKRGEWSDD